MILRWGIRYFESRSPALTPWAFTLVNVRAVRAIVVAAFATRELVDVLRGIRSGLPCVPHYHLAVPIHESDPQPPIFWKRILPSYRGFEWPWRIIPNRAVDEKSPAEWQGNLFVVLDKLFEVLGNRFRHGLLVLAAALLFVHRIGPNHLG